MSEGISPAQVDASAVAIMAAIAKLRDGSDRQFGLVRGGYLVMEGGLPVIAGPMPLPPSEFSARFPADCKWWPLVNADSQPFDAAKHWRLKPVYFAEDRQVIRLYPVVTKSVEFS
jgi:hypothetical protein